MSEGRQAGETAGADETVRYDDWREHLEAGVLLGVRCADCGHVTATPKRVCNDCGGRDLVAVELPTTGTVYSETKINVPPAGFDGRYQVAVVDLGEARLLARIDGQVAIGDDVAFAGSIAECGDPGPVFEPTD